MFIGCQSRLLIRHCGLCLQGTSVGCLLGSVGCIYKVPVWVVYWAPWVVFAGCQSWLFIGHCGLYLQGTSLGCLLGSVGCIVCAPKAGPLSGFSVFSSNVLYLCVANVSSTTFIYIFLKLATYFGVVEEIIKVL